MSDNKTLTIIADENIPMAEEFFAPYGQLHRLPGRTITAADVKDADALIVRSVTPVNKALLSGSAVKFVGTCTIGVDHLDTEYLRSHHIAFASSPGCNANSVVEYVFSVLANLRPQWLDKTIGIIGMGNVGSALYQRLKNLGLEVIAYDPLIDQDQYPVMGTLEQVLGCDIVSMHAPITTAGEHPSWHMIGSHELQQLPQGALLINAGRGACIDNNELLDHLTSNPGHIDVALDVWEPEPNIKLELLPHIAMASPHIAGYSYDGKLKGTAMIWRQFCRSFGLTIDESLAQSLSVSAPGDTNNVTPNFSQLERQAFLNQAILHSYNVRNDDVRMRDEASNNPENFAQRFDAMRKNYPKRLEFFHRQIKTEGQKEKQLLDQNLAALGYAQ